MKTKGKVLSVLTTAALASSLFYPYVSQAIQVGSPLVEASEEDHHEHEHLYDVRNVLSGIVPTDLQLKSANDLITTAGNGVRLQLNKIILLKKGLLQHS
jgi:extracellular elastinolytic metalloproteinase